MTDALARRGRLGQGCRRLHDALESEGDHRQRTGNRSTIITSQLSVVHAWVGDAILDRIM
jgi:hypothetical protein